MDIARRRGNRHGPQLSGRATVRSMEACPGSAGCRPSSAGKHVRYTNRWQGATAPHPEWRRRHRNPTRDLPAHSGSAESPAKRDGRRSRCVVPQLGHRLTRTPRHRPTTVSAPPTEHHPVGRAAQSDPAADLTRESIRIDRDRPVTCASPGPSTCGDRPGAGLERGADPGGG